MRHKAVSIGTAFLKLFRVAHTNQVGRNAACVGCHVRYHVPPDVRGRGISVQKNDWSSHAYINVGHFFSINFAEALGLFVG